MISFLYILFTNLIGSKEPQTMPLIYRHSFNANSNPWNTSHMAFVRLSRSHAFDKPLTIGRPEVRYCIPHTHTHTHQTNQCRNELVKKPTHISLQTHIQPHTHIHTYIYF